MKNKIKIFYYSCANVFSTIVSLLSVLFFSSFSCNKRIRHCIRKHRKYPECIIMGNGPSITSLLESNFQDIVEKDIFVVNFFCSTKYFEKVKPSFYVLLDPNLFVVSSPLESKIDEMIDKFNEVSWQMVLFIPSNAKHSLILKRVRNHKLIIVFFNSTPIEGIVILENCLFKRNLGMPMPQTVINASIFLAINLKFRIIHLYGVEQSWLKYLSVSNDNKVSVGLHHFYSGDDKTGENRTLSEFLLSQVAVFKSHMRLQVYAKNHGISILNHTPGSYIDAYDRVINDSHEEYKY